MSIQHAQRRARQKRNAPLRLFEPDQLYSARQIQAKLGGRVHITTVYGWARGGKFGPRVDVGPNSIRFVGRHINDSLTPRRDTK
jgi:hypothetical protein